MIPPVIQMPKMRHSLWITRIGSGKIQRETEALKIIADVLDNRIPIVQRKPGRELRLHHRLHCCRHGRSTKLGTLRVEVPTKTLKVPA